MLSDDKRHQLFGLLGLILVIFGIVFVVRLEPDIPSRALSEEQIRETTARLSEAFPDQLTHFESPPAATRIDSSWTDHGEFAMSDPIVFQRIEAQLEQGRTVHLFSWGPPDRRLHVFSEPMSARIESPVAAAEARDSIEEPPTSFGPFAKETRPGVAIGQTWLTFGRPVSDQWRALGLRRVTHSGRVYGEAATRIAEVDIEILVWLKDGIGNELHISPANEDAPGWEAVIRALEVNTESWWGSPEIEGPWTAHQCDTGIKHYTRGEHRMSLIDSPPGCETGLRYTLE